MIVHTTLHRCEQLSGSSTLQVQRAAEMNNCTSWHNELQHGMGSLLPAEYMVLELRNPFPQSLYLLIFQVQNIKWTLLNNTITKQLYWFFKNQLCKIVLQKLILKSNKVNTNYYPISVILYLKKKSMLKSKSQSCADFFYFMFISKEILNASLWMF